MLGCFRGYNPTFSGFPVGWARYSVSARCAAKEFDRSRPVDSQNGEAIGCAKPKLAAPRTVSGSTDGMMNTCAELIAEKLIAG